MLERYLKLITLKEMLVDEAVSKLQNAREIDTTAIVDDVNAIDEILSKFTLTKDEIKEAIKIRSETRDQQLRSQLFAMIGLSYRNSKK